MTTIAKRLKAAETAAVEAARLAAEQAAAEQAAAEEEEWRAALRWYLRRYWPD